MSIRWLVTVATVMALIGLTVSRSADALSCIPLGDVVAKMDVIVRGKITAIPRNGILELSVSRYYKGGRGPTQVHAEVPGLGQGQRMDWDSVPKVGDELIVGFVRRGDALKNEACNLFVQVEAGQEPPQDVRNYLGDGEAPLGGTEAQSSQSQTRETAVQGNDQSRNTLVWFSGGGLVLIGVASWVVWRWRRRAT